ncbi:gliding motility lipoprotein GldH [Flammeovirga sp. MY04]|uniref:gliding motility lipoprotein GldH n=1 Tax=Flammeovirga sp. MY04 TaxID=1191459 RepID=UPI00082551EF|nr:gliding motility lipoprotein GldH [Flammeovirga sp. MY04]ANQ51305.2 gliding motility lipoprotein GldH [Flammeovirga sp. MY04]
MMNKIYPFFIKLSCLLVALSFYSCDSKRVDEKYIDFTEGMWPVDSLASFDFDIENPNEDYNLITYIRNTNDYPYQNIYIKYSLIYNGEENNDTIINNTLSDFQLFEVKSGKPFGEMETSLGNSSTGAIYNHPLLLKKDISFPKEGNYSLEIQHYMRQDSLEGIIGVGYRIEHSK